ncbi:MAG: hypothetical protein IKX71_04805 [Bacteroidales bacterium]|nr:hypothetical protein [Bacteroidales bacterium]
MRLFRLLTPIACILLLAGCKDSSQTARMTPRIPVVNSHGIPGPENNHYKEVIFDHPVVVKDGWLQPWLDYDSLMVWSMNFLIDGPKCETPDGILPGYLATASYEAWAMVFPDVLTEYPEVLEGNYIWRGNMIPNNQGSNVYFAMKLFRYYYPYTGDIRALVPVKNILDRMLMFLTPDDWAWPGMVRTQDNDDPDGIWLDERLEPDKAAMTGIAFMDYAAYTGEEKYQQMAEHIADLLLKNIKDGSETVSPLPFRVNMRTGETEDAYTADMIFVVEFFDKLLACDNSLDKADMKAKRDLVFDWIMEYPVNTGLWSGYFEDVPCLIDNINQFSPMETARYLLDNPEACKDYKQIVLDLLAFVKERFGPVTRYGAASINEQDACYYEMGSHTARYGSVLARWAAETRCEQAKKEALSTLALAEYTAYNHTSKGNIAVNSVGLNWAGIWNSDCYFDYLPHFLEGMAAWPEIIPEGTDHIFSTTCMMKDVAYAPGSVKYTALDPNGTEMLKLSFEPKVLSGGKPLPRSCWKFGKYNGCDNILTINRKGVTDIEVVQK